MHWKFPQIRSMMKKISKPVEDLQLVDIKEYPVWYFANDDELGDTVVRPERKLPTQNLEGRLVFDEVLLANGNKVWAMLGNVLVHDPMKTGNFLTISVLRNKKWFHLARYFDVAHSRFGPDALAKFLDFDVDEVFPIQYDISRYSDGNLLALRGSVLKEPAERLTDDQIVRMAISGMK